MNMESKESRGRRGASWELPQQSGPIAAELWDVSESPLCNIFRKCSFNLCIKMTSPAAKLVLMRAEMRKGTDSFSTG